MVKEVQNRDHDQNLNLNQDQNHVHYHQHHRMNIPFIFYSIIFMFHSGRAAQAPKWDGDQGYRLHISPLNPRTSRRDIEKIFSKFGTINEVNSSIKVTLIVLII
jgi:arginine/serine-rich splicing factor 7